MMTLEPASAPRTTPRFSPSWLGGFQDVTREHGLEPLRVDARTDLVPMQNLGPSSILRHEREQVCRPRIARESRQHRSRQTVESHSRVRRSIQRPERNLAGRPDHEARSAAIPRTTAYGTPITRNPIVQTTPMRRQAVTWARV